MTRFHACRTLSSATRFHSGTHAAPLFYIVSSSPESRTAAQ
nr:hypothetical protein [uncultured Kingella sp.]